MASSSESKVPVVKYFLTKEMKRGRVPTVVLVMKPCVLQDATNAITICVESVGTLNLLGCQHTSKLEKTMVWIFELGGNVNALIHEVLEVGLVDLGSWKRREKG